MKPNDWQWLIAAALLIALTVLLGIALLVMV
jgi:hypothetical protein